MLRTGDTHGVIPVPHHSRIKGRFLVATGIALNRWPNSRRLARRRFLLEDRRQVFRDAVELDGAASKLESLLVILTGTQSIVERDGKLDHRFILDVRHHPDHEIDMPGNGIRLLLGPTGIDDDALDVVGAKLNSRAKNSPEICRT
jgi:hypothetical protein